MSTVRRCDARCHEAEGPTCECWCGGLFHGKGGESARQAFRETFGCEVPEDGEPTEQKTLFDETGKRWTSAIAAAVKARGE